MTQTIKNKKDRNNLEKDDVVKFRYCKKLFNHDPDRIMGEDYFYCRCPAGCCKEYGSLKF